MAIFRTSRSKHNSCFILNLNTVPTRPLIAKPDNKQVTKHNAKLIYVQSYNVSVNIFGIISNCQHRQIYINFVLPYTCYMYSLVLPHQNTYALLVHIISYIIYYVNKQVRSGAFVWRRLNEVVKIVCRDVMYFSSRSRYTSS